MAETQSLCIAVIDEDPATVRLLQRTLGSGEGHRLHDFPNVARFVENIESNEDIRPSAILLAFAGEGIAPLADFSRVQKCCPSNPIVILTDTQHRETAYEALRRGAADYFLQPLDVRRLAHVLPRMVRMQTKASPAAADATPMTMDEVKESAVHIAIRSTQGNVREAARILGIGRTTMYALMQRYDINASRPQDQDV